ncbi:10336_t:CDS:2 [Funneliformis mosseae]|uniref:10336_t:CDS:1 n=1 Tax=Funneliformis mosseae TaxID=27381 RepID=A0A9N9H509_FUNMO|nr:10336_t:CDS:2 [Funneliformis mosseae]
MGTEPSVKNGSRLPFFTGDAVFVKITVLITENHRLIQRISAIHSPQTSELVEVVVFLLGTFQK